MSSRDLTIAAYGAVLAVAVTVQLLAMREGSGLPTLGRVLNWALRRRSTQLGMLVVWWWVGWHWVTVR